VSVLTLCVYHWKSQPSGLAWGVFIIVRTAAAYVLSMS
jgi:hypothetical protein